jgi:flagellar hook assembly protein FlgD
VHFWDLAGRRVRELDLGWVAAGPVRFSWDGRGEIRSPLSSGTYWYRIETGQETQSGRVVYLR